MPSSTGYWDGTTWKTHKPKKGATAWTGVSNPNLNKTHINQPQSVWSGWNGVDNTNISTQTSQAQPKGFGTNTTLQPETQTIPYPPTTMYYHGTQPGYSQMIQPTYNQVAQAFQSMLPGSGLVMSQQGARSGNGSQIGQSLNGLLMGQSLNGSYMINQIPHNQTQTQVVPHTQTQVPTHQPQHTLAPHGV